MKSFLNVEERTKQAGKRIEGERKNKKMDQTSVAEYVGCNRATLRKWERGNSLPAIDQFFLLCELFGCEPGYLLCEYNERTAAAADIADTIGLLGEASHNLNKLRMNSVQKQDGPSVISLSFINYLSEHIDSLSSYISDKHNLEGDIYRFKIEMDNDDILKLLYKRSSTWFSTLNTSVNPYNSFSINDRINHFIKTVCEENHIEDNEKIDEIRSKAHFYAHVLDPMYQLQLDFAISQALQNIVAGFFSDHSQYSMNALSAITSPSRKNAFKEPNSKPTKSKTTSKLYISESSKIPIHIKTSGGSKSKKR